MKFQRGIMSNSLGKIGEKSVLKSLFIDNMHAKIKR